MIKKIWIKKGYEFLISENLYEKMFNFLVKIIFYYAKIMRMAFELVENYLDSPNIEKKMRNDLIYGKDYLKNLISDPKTSF